LNDPDSVAFKRYFYLLEVCSCFTADLTMRVLKLDWNYRLCYKYCVFAVMTRRGWFKLLVSYYWQFDIEQHLFFNL